MAGTEAKGGMRAAAGKVDITPSRPAYIAGYGSNRLSTGAHDPLMARCLVLESGGTRIAFVSCDLIGLPRHQVQNVRFRVRSILPENLLISATHTHSGPDTIGQWGPESHISGVDEVWMNRLLDQLVALVDETSSRLAPTVLRFASTTDIPPCVKNIRVGEILDKELGIMQALSEDGHRPIATFVNFACHPEVLNNHQITADFPHWLYSTVEERAGGICLFVNGALGGMVTADHEETDPIGNNWEGAQAIGRGLSECVLKTIDNTEIVTEASITAQQRVFRVPMENQRFHKLMEIGVFQNFLVDGKYLETEVNRITVGPAEFLTIPGEALPNVGFYLKRHMTGQPKFLLGLTCDELGYILSVEDYGLELYQYETSVSVGEEIEPLMVQNLRAMMASRAIICFGV